MKFLIQTNFMSNQQLELLKYVSDNYEFKEAIVIPFSDKFEIIDDDGSNDYFPYGSTLLSNLSLNRGLTGLHLNYDTFNYNTAVENRGDMLNDWKIGSADTIMKFMLMEGQIDKQWFVRPSNDTKQFGGMVATGKEIYDMLKSMIDSYEKGFPGTYSMHPMTQIVVSYPKEIQAEWRWFIVDGKIIDGAMYRAHGQLRRLHETDQAVIDEAQELANKWLPDSCVVMDTALWNDGKMFVIEFNTINSSGFYGHDVPKIFDAIAEFHNIKKVNL